MSKDPAFLFYPKDWLEGTAELLPSEKGLFIDLLCHQHQKGSIPSDTIRLARIVGLSHEEFLTHWTELSKKFEPFGLPNGDRMVNRKLIEVTTERLDKGKKNRIIGIFAGLLKKEGLPFNKVKLVKEAFNPTDFMEFDTERLTERLSEWFIKRLKSIEDANANKDKIEEKGVQGEEKEEINLQAVLHTWQLDKDFQEAYAAYRVMLRVHHGSVWSQSQHEAAMRLLKDYTKQESMIALNKSVISNTKGLYPEKTKMNGYQNNNQAEPPKITIHEGFKPKNSQ
jgi:hypothetical protein